MSAPTKQQIDTVCQNVANLMDLTNFVHSYAIDKINNAYLLQSQPQNDNGQAWADALIGGAIWGIGDAGFPGASFCAGILSGVFTMYTTNTPPNLQGTFADIWQRFDQTFLQAHTDLATIYSAPLAHWNDTYTGIDGNSYKVSDLTQAAMPGNHTSGFDSAADSILKAFDYNLWKQTLAAAWYQWEGSNDPMLFQGDQSWDAAGWARDFCNIHPAYYIKWQWYDNHASSCCSEAHGYNIWEIWLGQNAGTFSDAAAPQNLCDYLFKDDGGGTIVRPSALTTRADVFSNFGLTQKTFYVNDPSGAAMTPRAYVEFKNRPGKTFEELLQHTSRADLEAQVRKAAADPAVAYELQRRPKQTLLKLINLKVPDHIQVEVIAEKPDHFYFVLPKVGAPQG
jgi:hypothetical protein